MTQQKPRTLPKMFNRKSGDTHANGKSTNVHTRTEPDYEDFYWIGESEESHLFADDEVIIVDEEEVWDKPTRFQASPQMDKARPQTVPPLPKRNPREDKGLVGERILHGVGTAESNSQSSLASHEVGSKTGAGRGEDNYQRQHAGKANSKAISKSTAKPKQKRHRASAFTDNDLQLLETIHWMGEATPNHLVYASTLSPEYVQKRIKKLEKVTTNLEKGGYIKSRKIGSEMTMHSLTRDGLARIGRSNEKVVGSVARSTLRHRNQINSAVLFFKIGAGAWVERSYQLDIKRMKQNERNNKKIVRENELLKYAKERILAKPEGDRNADEWKILASEPRMLAPAVQPKENLNHGLKDFRAHPNAVFPERFIDRAIAENGEQYCSIAWETECEKWIANPAYPVKAWGDDTVTGADIQAMYNAVDGNEWIFRHWNGGGFKSRHQPDGVVLLPHQRDNNGNIHPMSWWIEVEANRKSDSSEIERVIEQALDSKSPVRGVLYVTEDVAVRSAVLKAMAKVTKKLTNEYEMRGAPRAEAHATAKQFVESNCRILKAQLVYPHEKDGFWG